MCSSLDGMLKMNKTVSLSQVCVKNGCMFITSKKPQLRFLLSKGHNSKGLMVCLHTALQTKLVFA